jgi:hypothetical protein
MNGKISDSEKNVRPTRKKRAMTDSVNLHFILISLIEIQDDHSKDGYAARVGLKFEQTSKRNISSHCSLFKTNTF